MELKFQVQTRIAKPAAEVFKAIVEPDSLKGFFVATSSGPLTEGATVEWTFEGYDGIAMVQVIRVIPNEEITFEWEASGGLYSTRVEVELQSLDDGTTMVAIRESGWRENEDGLKASYSNCGGWMHMLCCLKAHLEHGINLRLGAKLDCD